MPKMGVAPRNPQSRAELIATRHGSGGFNYNRNRALVEGQAVTIQKIKFEDALDTLRILTSKGLPVPEEIERVVSDGGGDFRAVRKNATPVEPMNYRGYSKGDLEKCPHCYELMYRGEHDCNYLLTEMQEFDRQQNAAIEKIQKKNLVGTRMSAEKSLADNLPYFEEEPDPYEGMDDLDKWLAVHDDVLFATYDEVLAVQTADEVVPSQKPKPPAKKRSKLNLLRYGIAPATVATIMIITGGLAVGAGSVFFIVVVSVMGMLMGAIQSITAELPEADKSDDMEVWM